MALAIGLVGCRANSAAPGGAPALGQDAGDAAPVGGSLSEAAGAADAASHARTPFVSRFPVAHWATWPMPNTPTSGLPNPQSYDTRIAGVVTDQVTGLMWQRSVANAFLTWDDAQRQCGEMTLAGYDDWRLPSRIELVSLLDASRTQPSINLSVFLNTTSEWFWTSSVLASNPKAAWFVYFYFGYPNQDDKANRFQVRCVRTVVSHPEPSPRYEMTTAEVRDVATGLTWQRKAPEKKLRFEAARGYCTQLTLGGKKGWRLPSLVELLTLVDEQASTPPLIDGTAFPDTAREPYWSSSSFSGGPTSAWYVSFNEGYGLYDLLAATYHVRCVTQ
jgi:hypothetical protein